MQIYKVGGYVRDRLLGLSPHDCDYVVVGSTTEEMLARGFIPVGRDFPVFLHPQTKEEYALARQERKIAAGHTGFAINSTSEITLEQDLSRRDLTINAIALDDMGNYIDPYHGRDDIKHKILRHVSPAFSEDPLRILRVARFAAQLNFAVADETMELLCKMAASGEGRSVSRERISSELAKALSYSSSDKFFTILYESANLAVFFPLLAQATAPKWSEFITIFSTTNSSEQRWLILALFINASNRSGYTELTLNKARQQQLIKIYWLNLLLNTPTIPPVEILAVFHHLEIWRNYSEFDKLWQLFCDYLQNIKHDTLAIKKLKRYHNLASRLKDIPSAKQLENTPQSHAAQLVQSLRIKAIDEFINQ